MDFAEACDRIEINSVIDKFAVGQDEIFGAFPIRMDGGAASAVLDLFAPAGILHTPFSRADGREEIRAAWERVAKFEVPADGPKYVRHHLTSRQTVMIDSTNAFTTVYVQGLTDRGLDHWGFYEDRMVKLAEGWKFAERLVIVQGWVQGGYYAGLPNPQNPVRSW